MIKTAIVDSGPLLAAANSADAEHARCLAELKNPRYHLVIPALCVAEVAYLLGQRQGPVAEARFLRALENFDVQAPRAEEWAEMAHYVDKYRDLPLGAADASVVVLAERYATDLVLSLDRRHMLVVRPRHCERLRVLPEPLPLT